MNNKLEIVTEFKVGANILPPIGVIHEYEQIPNLTKHNLMTAWRVAANHTGDSYDWDTIKTLLDQLSDTDMLYLQAGQVKQFAMYHDDTRYRLVIKVNEYQQEEQTKGYGVMGWVKNALFGKTVIRRTPEDIHVHPNAKTDLDKPQYEASYQRAFFDKLVAEWQIANDTTDSVDADVEAKLVIIGKAAYLLRGAAAITPDEVLWSFLSATWADCVGQGYPGTGGREKILMRGIKVCHARDDHGMYTKDKMVLAQFYPVGNDYTYRTLLPHLGGNKEQERSVELDVKVGPMLMDRLTNLFSLGEVLCVTDRDVTNTNALLALGYKVVSGPHDTINQAFTRLSKAK